MRVLRAEFEPADRSGQVIGLCHVDILDEDGNTHQAKSLLLEVPGSSPRVSAPTIRWRGKWIRAFRLSDEVWRQVEAASLVAFEKFERAGGEYGRVSP